MNKLIKSATLVASVGAMLCIAGCGCGGGEKPEDVVLKVLTTMQSGKADQAFLDKYCEKETAQLFAGFGEQMTESLKGATFAVAYTFVDDDLAVVKIKKEGGSSGSEDMYYDVKKIDDQWKVQINKKASDDYYCGPSKKTVDECLAAFKASVFAFENDYDNYKDRCTKEFWDEMLESGSKAPKEDMAEAEKFIAGLKVNRYEKSILYDGFVEVELAMEDGSRAGELFLGVVDGKWKVCRIPR